MAGWEMREAKQIQRRFYGLRNLLGLAFVLGLAWQAAVFTSRSPSLPYAPSVSTPISHPITLYRVDFNRDGLADCGTILRVHNSTIIAVSLSGENRTRRIRVEERLAGVVAVDVDHDGNTDLLALDDHLRVLVWLNNGKGRFVRRDPASRRNPTGPTLQKRIWGTSALFFLGSDSHQDKLKFLRADSRFGPVNFNESGRRDLSSGFARLEDAGVPGCPPRGPPLSAFQS